MEKYQKINPIVRWTMILSLMIIFLTLLVSWILWLLVYRNAIGKLLNDFSFLNLSIITLTFSGLAFLFALPLIGLTKKNIVTNTFSLLGFILALSLASLSLLLYHSIKIDSILTVAVPWIIIIVATMFLFVSSGVNLIIVGEKNKKPSVEPIIKNLEPDAQVENNIVKTEIKDKVLEKTEVDFSNLPIFKEQVQIQTKKSVVKSKQNADIPKIKWTKKQIKEVWEKAEVIPGVNKDLYRKDYAGAWMFFADFINSSDENNLDIGSYSWTITNHKPISQLGTNDLENLVPMNVINVITKGQNYPKWKTKISSRGNENIIKEQIWSN